MTVNAYLGAWGIVRAAGGRADIVVTGRVADTSLSWWGRRRGGTVWARSYDELAGAVVAGHLIECGTQVTGGNYSGFGGLDLDAAPAFPIAEVAGDGSAVITKAAGGER